MRNKILGIMILVMLAVFAACGGEEGAAADAPAPNSAPYSVWARDLDVWVPIDEALQVVRDIHAPFRETMLLFDLAYNPTNEPITEQYMLATSLYSEIQTIEDIRDAFLVVFTEYYVTTIIDPMLFERETPFYKMIDGRLHRLLADFPTFWVWLDAEDVRVGAFTPRSFTAIVYCSRHHMYRISMYVMDFEYTENGWRINAIEIFHGG